ncbi:hypothetical protein Tco_0104956 [Tanacetum coccineum]
MKRVNTFVDYRTELVEESSRKAEAEIAQESSLKRAGDELEQENAKKQKVDEDKEITELQSLIEVVSDDEEEVAIDVVPLATKPPTIIDWKIHKEGKKSYYQIIRADGKSQMYRVFNQMLKSFSKEDLEDLYKLVKAKYGSTRPIEDLDLILWVDLKTMFKPHVKDTVWRNQQNYSVLDWKLYDSCRVHSLRKQNGRIVGIKRLLDDLRVTIAKGCITAAKLKKFAFPDCGEDLGELFVHFLTVLVKHLSYPIHVKFLFKHELGELVFKLIPENLFRTILYFFFTFVVSPWRYIVVLIEPQKGGIIVDRYVIGKDLYQKPFLYSKMGDLFDQVLEMDPGAFDGFVDPLFESKDHVSKGRGYLVKPFCRFSLEGEVKEMYPRSIPCGFVSLMSQELGRECSRKVLRGVDDLVLVLLEEDASSSKRFLPL